MTGQIILAHQQAVLDRFTARLHEAISRYLLGVTEEDEVTTALRAAAVEAELMRECEAYEIASRYRRAGSAGRESATLWRLINSSTLSREFSAALKAASSCQLRLVARLMKSGPELERRDKVVDRLQQMGGKA